MRIPVLGILLLAALLRFYGLGDKSLWGDEIAQAVWSAWDWPQLWQKFRAPPDFLSHFVLVHLAHMFGTNEFWTRLPSAFTSLLTVPLAYVLTKRLTDRATALIAMLLVAVAPYQIWYAQEARMYAALGCYAILALYFMVRLVARDSDTAIRVGIGGAIQHLVTGEWKLVLGLVVGNTLVIYTHLFGVFPILAEAVIAAGLLIALWIRTRRVTMPRWAVPLLIAFGLTILLALPLAGGTVPYVLQGGKPALNQELFPSQRFQLTPAIVWEVLGDIGLGAREPWRTTLSLALAVIGLGVLAVRKPRAGWIAAVWLVLPFLLLGVAQPRHTVSARYLIFLQPVYLMLIAYAVAQGAKVLTGRLRGETRDARAWNVSPVTATFVAAGLVYLGLIVAPPLVELYPRAKLNDWRALARFIEANGRAGDLVFGERNTPNMNALTYYLPNLLRYHTPPTNVEQLEGALKENRRIWYVSAGEFFDPEGEAWARENLEIVPVSQWAEPTLRYAPESAFEYTQSEHLATLYFHDGNVPAEIVYMGRQGFTRGEIERVKVNPGETLEAELELNAGSGRDLEFEFSSKKAAAFDVTVNGALLAQVRDMEADKGARTAQWHLAAGDDTVQVRVTNRSTEFPLFIMRIALREAH